MNARGIRIGLVGTGMLFLTSPCTIATEFAVQDTLHPACPEPPPVEFSPGHLIVDPTNDVILAADANGTYIAALDPWSLEVQECFDIGCTSWRLALDDLRRRLYVLNRDDDLILEIDADTHAILDTLPSGPDPQAMAVNPTTQKLYVTNYYHDIVTVVDAVGDTVITTIWVGYHPGTPSVSQRHNRVYVPVWMGYLVVIDGEYDIVEENLYLFGGICEPELTWYNESKQWLYVSPFNCPLLTILHGGTLETLAEGLYLPGYPITIFGNEEREQAYVAAETTLAVVGPELCVVQCAELGSYYSMRGCCHEPSGRLFVRATVPPPALDPAVLVLWEESQGTGESDPFGQSDPFGESGRTLSLTHGPTPFCRTSRITCSLPASRPAMLRVYNPTGQLVRTLIDDPAAQGMRTVFWDGTNESGDPVPSGVYYYSLETPLRRVTRRTLRLR